jgi:hypothetical protein
VQQRIGQAAERPCVVDPEVPSSTRVHALQICIYSANEQIIHGTVCALHLSKTNLMPFCQRAPGL